LSGASFEGVSLGDGDVDLKEIVRRLNERGYQGAYVLEYEGVGVEAEGIRESYTYFNTLV
jgi:sugar phosphate isomerase/epimerase